MPSARLLERQQLLLKYEIPTTGDLSVSFLFATLLREQARLGITDFTVSQSTLEKIFLTITSQQNAAAEGVDPDD